MQTVAPSIHFSVITRVYNVYATRWAEVALVENISPRVRTRGDDLLLRGGNRKLADEKWHSPPRFRLRYYLLFLAS